MNKIILTSIVASVIMFAIFYSSDRYNYNGLDCKNYTIEECYQMGLVPNSTSVNRVKVHAEKLETGDIFYSPYYNCLFKMTAISMVGISADSSMAYDLAPHSEVYLVSGVHKNCK